MTTQFEIQAVKIFKALADPTRYKIIRLLSERTELSCGDFDREFDISKPALSNHYRILENASLILTRKKGQHVIVSLNEAVLDKFLPQFRQIHLHQDAQFMEE
ncbi:MAG: helix-turn-helix transcriptional regulator [Candidatus Marinimicrobia bacterium]|nr:helix-turn-helix transcriptional regulator [Candidatus Neomarinimicrobiota bacterium]